MVLTLGRVPKLGCILKIFPRSARINLFPHYLLLDWWVSPFSTPESLPDVDPGSPMEPKLLDDEGLVLEEYLQDSAC